MKLSPLARKLVHQPAMMIRVQLQDAGLQATGSKEEQAERLARFKILQMAGKAQHAQEARAS